MEEEVRDDGPTGATGHAAVDAAVARLGAVASLQPGEQVAAYEEAHRTLQETLGTIEER